MVGQKTTCPECRYVTSVPSADAPPVSTGCREPSAEVSGPEPERVLCERTPAMFRSNPIGFILCLLVIPAMGLGALILAIWWHQCQATTLSITNRRITLRHGIWTKYTNEVRHCDVRYLRVVQNYFGEMMGVGKLEVGTAGHGGIEITVSGIANPHRVAELIRKYQ